MSVAKGNDLRFLRLILDAEGRGHGPRRFVVAEKTCRLEFHTEALGRQMVSDDSAHRVQWQQAGRRNMLLLPATPNIRARTRCQFTEADQQQVLVDPMTALLVHIPGNGPTAVPAACERSVVVFWDRPCCHNLAARLSSGLDTVGDGLAKLWAPCSAVKRPVAG